MGDQSGFEQIPQKSCVLLTLALPFQHPSDDSSTESVTATASTRLYNGAEKLLLSDVVAITASYIANASPVRGDTDINRLTALPVL